MIIKLTVDRIESGIAVCIDEKERKYECSINAVEGDIFEAEISDIGEVTFIRKLENETLEKKTNNASRLNSLFMRGGNKK